MYCPGLLRVGVVCSVVPPRYDGWGGTLEPPQVTSARRQKSGRSRPSFRGVPRRPTLRVGLGVRNSRFVSPLSGEERAVLKEVCP